MENFSLANFMREGGWGMWPILILGLMALGSAIRYAMRSDTSCLRFAAALWVTLMVVVVHATITDLAAVFGYLEDPARVPDAAFSRVLVTGLKESTRPAVLGGIFLTLVPLLAAIGIYRSGASMASPDYRPSAAT